VKNSGPENGWILKEVIYIGVFTIHAGFAIISDVRMGPGENHRTVYSAAGEGERSDVLKKLRDLPISNRRERQMYRRPTSSPDGSFQPLSIFSGKNEIIDWELI
jgi:hypothetical protein